MGDFDFLNTWEFWISVVIVGLLVNLLAAALWKYVPTLLAKVSDRWAKRNEMQRQKREKAIAQIMADPKFRHWFEYRLERARLTVLILMIQFGFSGTIFILTMVLLWLDVTPSPRIEALTQGLNYSFGFGTLLSLIGYLSSFQRHSQLNSTLSEAALGKLVEDKPPAERDSE